jgi:hypothetical protein
MNFRGFANILKRILSAAADERIETKFNRLTDKVDQLDGRMDGLEVSQAEQNQKLSAIHQITLANNEALEQKLNLSNASSQNAKDIADIRFSAFSESFKRLEDLVLQVVRRDSNHS